MVLGVLREHTFLNKAMYTYKKNNVTKVPKLRTYIKYKDEYLTETYAYKVYDSGQRSIMAQFRSGILPLSIGTGIYTYTPEELRLCIFC